MNFEVRISGIGTGIVMASIGTDTTIKPSDKDFQLLGAHLKKLCLEIEQKYGKADEEIKSSRELTDILELLRLFKKVKDQTFKSDNPKNAEYDKKIAEMEELFSLLKDLDISTPPHK